MRPRNPDLDEYREYLKLLSLEASTIRVYVTQVRRVLRDVPTGTRDDLTEYFYSALDAHTRASTRVAWRHYVDFRKQVDGTVIEEPLLLPRARAKQMKELEVSLPISVQSAISILMNRDKWDLKVIADAKWAQFTYVITSRFGDVELRHAHGKVDVWFTTEEILRPLKVWADVDGNPKPEQPLVPVSTNMMQPVSILALKKALRLS
jgi:hypothetical protein